MQTINLMIEDVNHEMKTPEQKLELLGDLKHLRHGIQREENIETKQMDDALKEDEEEYAEECRHYARAYQNVRLALADLADSIASELEDNENIDKHALMYAKGNRWS